MSNENATYLFTSESVTEGHPDKLCDQVSDAILDAILAKEIELEKAGYISPSGKPADVSQVRCACETVATTGTVFVTGEIRTQAYVDVDTIVRDVVRSIGYDRAKYGFDCDTCGVINAIHSQSPDIARASMKAGRPSTAKPPIRKTKPARATRAWCSATPATKRARSCRCPFTWRIASLSA